MTENDSGPTPGVSNLHRRAEDRVRAGGGQAPGMLSPEASQQVLHDLQVHQIELELQNEELRRTQVALDAARARYFDLYHLAPVGYVTFGESGLILEVNLTAARLLGVTRDVLIHRPLTHFIVPDDQDIFYRQRKHLFDTGTPQACELRLTSAAAPLLWVQLEMTRVQDADGTLLCRMTMSDITARKQAEQLLDERVQAHDREQTQLLELSHTLASTLEFQPGVFLNQMQALIGCAQGGLFALQDPALMLVAMSGRPQGAQPRPFRVCLNGRETLAALFSAHQPVRIADVASDDPPARFLRALLADEAAGPLEGMRSWMWVPLEAKDRLLGGVGLAHAQPNFFTPHHAHLALRAAYQAATAMVNEELYSQARALAVLEERQRLAHSLHDAVNQSLFSAGLIAEVLPRLWERDQAEARRSIQDLVRLTRGAQAEMRALLAELRPATLVDSNLGDLLRLLGNALAGRSDIPVNMTISGEYIPPADVQVAFYRIAQEALNNLSKHSKASQVELTLEQANGAVDLWIRDDGQGFEPDQTFPGHYGLRMMRERAEAVGAQLWVTSQPNYGTELSLHWAEVSPEESK
jgi:PAS domain S-box-containing protein